MRLHLRVVLSIAAQGEFWLTLKINFLATINIRHTQFEFEHRRNAYFDLLVEKK